jgi:GH24 family phage-related lysozyme (muramidase)
MIKSFKQYIYEVTMFPPQTETAQVEKMETPSPFATIDNGNMQPKTEIKFAVPQTNSNESKQKNAKEIASDFITLPDVEGFREKSYQDKGGVWTVGPGITRYSTGMAVGEGDIIPKQYGMKELHYHLDNVVIPTLSKKIPNWNKMNENQKAALISFSYNAGQNFYGSEKYKEITQALSNPTNWDKVPAALNLYVKGLDSKTGHKVVQDGLVRRRKNEGAIWSGTYVPPK